MNSDYQKITEIANEIQCDFMDFKFVDLLGTWHHLTLSKSKFSKELFTDGIGFDGSSIHGFKELHESDMILLPDITTFIIDPVYPEPTLSFICDILDPVSKEYFARDSRQVAKKAEAYLKGNEIADTSFWGPELEFFIFDSACFDSNSHESYFRINSREGIWNSGKDRIDNPGNQINYKEGYFAVPPSDQMYGIRSIIASAMIKAGLKIEFHHHEVATAGQTEIGMRYGTLTQQADNVLLSKYIAKNIAFQNGYSVTFMPKPLYNDNGNAMHIHQSLWKDGTNLFFDLNGYAQLSQLAKYYIGGILAHAPALAAFCNPSTNSYRRLVPGFEAPVYLVYSQRNRSSAVRIPVYSPNPESKRIEYRCPDATCNPYLAFAAVLMAGLDGISNKIDPGQPLDKDIFKLDKAELGNICSVPGSLDESLRALECDREFLLKGGVFTPDLVETWIRYKRDYELKLLSLRPHPFEFSLYYNV
jgi:glutamine synthetase